MASAGALQGLLELSDACNDPVRNALREAAGSGDMADIVLEAEDGERCPAIKALLAIRSPVFRQMFAGNFADAAESSVRVPIRSGEVVRSLIEFCYTNETELLTWESWKTGHALLEEETDHLPACHVRLCALVALAVAGDLFGVPMLCGADFAVCDEVVPGVLVLYSRGDSGECFAVSCRSPRRGLRYASSGSEEGIAPRCST
eukprot:Hpha_TRINITY_DN15786_c2_g6::TRINITY_DN15786_c2_g6_i1::g.37420::m.37420